LSRDDLAWFHHHAEVDIAHAQQGLDTLVDYTTYYGIDDESVRTIAEITFRDNIFLKRYFDLQVETALASAGAL
jgi:pyrroloquinoline quinone (PQQ) biosynthesis protein C